MLTGTASQSLYPRQYLGKEPLVYHKLSHLKRDVSAEPENVEKPYLHACF